MSFLNNFSKQAIICLSMSIWSGLQKSLDDQQPPTEILGPGVRTNIRGIFCIYLTFKNKMKMFKEKVEM